MTSNLRLQDKVAIVTGSGKGIGRAEALLLAAQGAKVVISDIGFDDGVSRAETVAEEIRGSGGEAAVSTDDIGTFDGCERLIATAVDNFGRLDILVNNAGLRAANPIEDIDEASYDLVLGSHLKATFATIKFAVPHFLAQGGGVIVNTGSESGLGHPYNSAYAAAKEGIAGLTRSLARELGPRGIRCNLVRPRSEVTTKDPKFMEVLHKYRPERNALGRFGLGRRGDVFRPSDPEHVAPLVVWLCTDAAREINGRDFFTAGIEVGLWSEVELARSAVNPDGWTLDLLDRFAPETISQGLMNEYLSSDNVERAPRKAAWG
ncbi:SDR family NAD(P)-dependent oxidoreductase [Rhodococcus koreensis]